MSAAPTLVILPNLDLGGTESCLMNFLRGGVKFDFVVHGEAGFYEEEARALGAQIHRVPTRSDGFWKNIFAMRKLYKNNRQYKTAIICTDHAFAFVELFSAWWCGVKNRIAWSHFSDYTGEKGAKRTAHYFARPWLRLFAKTRLACTHEAGVWLFGRAAVRRRSFHIIPNAIDAEKYAFEPDLRKIARSPSPNGLISDTNFTDKTLAVGIIGRLAPVKNHVFALEIFVQVIKREPDARLFIIGDGELRQMLKEKADALGISEQVVFTGAVTNMPAWYQALDVVLIPSLHEGLPMIAVEAQAAGLPVLLAASLSREVAITSLARYVKADTSAWVDAILARRGAVRDAQEFSASTFCIKNAAPRLAQIIEGAANA
jgi:glycosyltransferase involved in cell wall biosynthesis